MVPTGMMSQVSLMFLSYKSYRFSNDLFFTRVPNLKKIKMVWQQFYFIIIMNHSCFTLKLVYTLLQVHYIH